MNTKMTNDFVIETIQALRGGRSKSWLSQRLKYKFNQVYLWESERRAFYWSDFEAICEVMKRPFQENAKLFFSNKEKFKFIFYLSAQSHLTNRKKLLRFSVLRLLNYLGGFQEKVIFLLYKLVIF